MSSAMKRPSMWLSVLRKMSRKRLSPKGLYLLLKMSKRPKVSCCPLPMDAIQHKRSAFTSLSSTLSGGRPRPPRPMCRPLSRPRRLPQPSPPPGQRRCSHDSQASRPSRWVVARPVTARLLACGSACSAPPSHVSPFVRSTSVAIAWQHASGRPPALEFLADLSCFPIHATSMPNLLRIAMSMEEEDPPDAASLDARGAEDLL